jgi:aminoglycoside/choline kinase family phosphotransferase
MKFFVKYFLNELMELNIQENNETHSGIFADLKSLCEKLDKCERILCHRDYHSRNLMIKNDHIYWIDFQDARMGPHTYDVVSLVRDSYVKMDWNTRQILFDYYFSELNNARLKHNLTPILKADYETELNLMGLQRNLKAIGSFAYLACTKSKRNYLQYIKPTLEIICASEAKCINPTLEPQNDNFPNLFALLKTFLSRDYK